jgi:hypothetical protein
MMGALRQPPPAPGFTIRVPITPVTPIPCQFDAKLSATIAKAIELSDLEPAYDFPSPRQEQLDILMPQALQRGMFDAYVTAAAAYTVHYSRGELSVFLGNLFRAGAYQVAFDAFDRLGGWSADSELAEVVTHLPDELLETWMNCVLDLQPPKQRTRPIVAAGHRLLPRNVFERSLRCSCELIDAEARQTALADLVGNWRYHAQSDQLGERTYLQILLRSSSRIGRFQVARDLTSTAAALCEALTPEDLDEITSAVTDIQHWWP